MNPLDILGVVSSVVGKVLDFIPDPAERAKAQAAALKQAQDVLAAQNTAQAEINKTEAASSSIFVAGWRPFIGWVCGCGIAWTYVLAPMVACLIRTFDASFDLPNLNTDTLLTLVLGMLGMGGLHVYENVKTSGSPR